MIYARAFNSEHQMELVTEVAARFAERKGMFRLLVVSNSNCRWWIRLLHYFVLISRDAVSWQKDSKSSIVSFHG